MTLFNPLGSSRNFLAGGGEMGALMRIRDWSRSPIGEPQNWPQSLRTALRLLLTTKHPMFIWWGPRLIQFYNDPYRHSIGPERHPLALGQEGRQCWDEIWPIIGPQIEQVMSGRGSTWHENALVPITRHGRREDVYWTYGYSPIDDPVAPTGVGGVLVICTETTSQVRAAQRLAQERDQFAELFDQAPSFMAMLRGPTHRFERVNPAYLRLVGHRPLVGRTLAQALPDAVEQGYLALLDQVYETGEAFTADASKYVVQAKPGEPGIERFVDFVFQPLKDPAGHVTGIFVEGFDVTDRVSTTVELRRAEARLREFAAAPGTPQPDR